MRKLEAIVIHHSASTTSTTAETIRKWHIDRGWSDIGYHYVIERSGEIKPGRPLHRIGAHARRFNHHSVGICVAGFNPEPHPWNADQRKSLRRLVNALQIVFGDLKVYGHRDTPKAATLCPGLDVKDVLYGG